MIKQLNFLIIIGKKISESRLFKEFYKNIVKEKIPIKAFLQQLLDDSFIYRKINTPSREDWTGQNEYSIYFSIYAISEVFGIDVANAMLISLIREYQNKKISLYYITKALNSIEKFHFIHNAICSNRSSGLDQMYSKYSRELLNATNKQEKHLIIDKFIKNLEEKLPNKVKFEANFDSKLQYLSKTTKQKKLVSYILRKIELKKQNKNVELHNISIEHIYPEKSVGKWETIEDKYISNIGNLVLLDAGLNSKVGNMTYPEKKNIIIKESTIISTKEIFEKYINWSSREIEERRNFLVEYTYNDLWT